jgi:serine phosphatase RsbU (regulator of sigma subunit)/PAS domain-containing protein
MAENMPQDAWAAGQAAELAARRDALRLATAVPGGDPWALLEAALIELDAAIESLAAQSEGFPDTDAHTGARDAAADAMPDALRAERRLLRAAFQEAPVPLFLLERDGTVRRANTMAGDLIGSSPGYATGKQFTTFVDLPSRAAVQSQLGAAVRTGKPRQVACRLLTVGGPAEATLSARVIALPGDPKLLAVSATTGEPTARKVAPARENASDTRTMTRRMDMITAVTRLLLDNSTFSEAVTLQRCARLLAGEIASWVIVDVERAGQLRRQFAIGSRDAASEQLARTVRGIDPEPGTLCWHVHASGKSALVAHAEDAGLIGKDQDGTPLLMLLGATSVISVPISEGGTNYGTLTLARLASEGHFEVADLALAEELGEHLAIAMRVDRMFRRRSEVAQALQASLLPGRLPDLPGLDLAASYIVATDGQEISGDFYDVFPMKRKGEDTSGWGIVVGDVCGKGEEAAAMTAAARHATRALAHATDDPADVLRRVNDVLLAADFEDRFVTAELAYLENQQSGGLVRVTLGSSGHPGPVLVRADGRLEVLDSEGLPLGLFPDAEPGLTALTLRTGDLLLFYTDGVTEARGADMTYFEDRLIDQLAAVAGRSAAETVRAVQELVTEFSGGELRDDMTMLAVKVTGELVLILIHVLHDLAAAWNRYARPALPVGLAGRAEPAQHAGDRWQSGLHPLIARVPYHVRREGRLVHTPHAGPPPGPADQPSAKPASTAARQEQPEQSDEDEHEAGGVQVED